MDNDNGSEELNLESVNVDDLVAELQRRDNWLDCISSRILIDELQDRYEWPEEADISNYTDNELIDELSFRERTDDVWFEGSKSVLYSLWLKRRMGKPFERELDELIYNVIGRVL